MFKADRKKETSATYMTGPPSTSAKVSRSMLHWARLSYGGTYLARVTFLSAFILGLIDERNTCRSLSVLWKERSLDILSAAYNAAPVA